MADAIDSKSIAQKAWGFDSLHRHQPSRLRRFGWQASHTSIVRSREGCRAVARKGEGGLENARLRRYGWQASHTSTRSKSSHIAVPALDGLADHRRRDLVGDLDVPDFAFALRGEVGEQLRDDRYVADLVSAQAEAVRDFFERRPAEHGQAIVDAVGAQLVKFRAISAVVHCADQDAKSLTLERLELLDMEQEPAVAFEQHDLALATLPARRRDPERIAQAVADRAELTDRRVALRRPATHLGVEIGLMAAADDDVPVLWNDRVDGPDHLAWIQHPGRHVEWHRSRCLGRDAKRRLLPASLR